jgi:hypothetical protein
MKLTVVFLELTANPNKDEILEGFNDYLFFGRL